MVEKRDFIGLYKQCFKDNESFVSYFFADVYENSARFFEEVDRELASAVYLVPKKLSYFGKIVDLPFVTALSVAEKFRRRGFAERVMKQAFACAEAKGAPFIALSPVDEGYYEKYGFVGCEYEKNSAIEEGEYDGLRAESCEDSKRFAQIYESSVRRYDIRLVKNASDFERKKYGSDEAFVLRRGGEDSGFAFFDSGVSELIVPPDFTAENSAVISGLSGKTIRVACGKSEGACKTMFRAVNLEAALSAAEIPRNLKTSVYVEDSFFGDAALEIEEGRAKPTWKKSCGIPAPKCDYEIGIAELSALLCGAGSGHKLSEFFRKGSRFFCDRY